MEDSQLQGGLCFFRLLLSQPELRLVDLCSGVTINKIVVEIDKRPTVKQCDPHQSVSRFYPSSSLYNTRSKPLFA